MFHKNKVKNNMYKILKSLDKTDNYELTKNKILKSINENKFNYAIYECDRHHFLDGFICSRGIIHNDFFIKVPEKFYITQDGYNFLKNYYSNLFNLIRDILLMIITAYITVLINNKWSNTNQSCYCFDNICSQNCINSPISNNHNN